MYQLGDGPPQNCASPKSQKRVDLDKSQDKDKGQKQKSKQHEEEAKRKLAKQVKKITK